MPLLTTRIIGTRGTPQCCNHRSRARLHLADRVSLSVIDRAVGLSFNPSSPQKSGAMVRIRRVLSRLNGLYLSPSSPGTQFRMAVSTRTDAPRALELSDLSDPARFTRAVEALLRSERLDTGPRSAVRRATELIASHVGDGDHAEITDELRDLGENTASLSGIGHERLFMLTRTARTAGLFSASHPFEMTALEAFGARARQVRGVRGRLQRARWALAVGDIEQAAGHAAPLRRRGLWKRATEVHATLRYVDLVTGAVPALPDVSTPQDTRLASIVRGRTVLLYGPGPTVDTRLQDLGDAPVARVLMPGVTWNSDTDLADNRVDIAYANGETADWLTSLSTDELQDVVTRSGTVILKGWGSREQGIQSLATNVHLSIPRPAMIGGHPNMAPIIIWDLLLRGCAHVHVMGTSFFLGPQAYRDDHLRVFPGQGRSNAFGSLGNGFERCHSLAAHGPTSNRQLVLNLLRTNRINGDTLFRKALSLSAVEYLSELDALYGIPRR